MESACVRHTLLPHTAKLFDDYLYHFDRVARFYRHDPFDPESYRRAAASIRFAPEARAALIEVLRDQNGPSAALDLLSRDGTVAVVTGQQVGLFSGPCYTVYKALTASRLARQLTESGIPAVPVFWLATEDHDFEEISFTWVFDAAARPVKLSVPADNRERRPVGGVPVGRPPIDELRRALSDLPFCNEVVDLVADAYQPGRTFGAAFEALIKRILGAEELLYFDPMHPGARRLAAPLLSRAVRMGAELNSRVRERNQDLAEGGYHTQVHVEPHTSFVFLLEKGRRLTLHRDGQEYAVDGRRIPAEELAARAEDLSPNALLRPVVQDSMFPTVAYVGGPAELAYLAQSEVLYRALLDRMPVAVPRQSATLLDTRAAKLLERYKLSVPDLFAGAGEVREKIAAQLVPANLARRMGETRVQLGALLGRAQDALGEFDSTLAQSFTKNRRKMEYQLAKAERKAAREAFRRDEQAGDAAARLTDLILPEKHPQERLYSILPFLARHGLDLPAALAGRLSLECRDHRIFVV